MIIIGIAPRRASGTHHIRHEQPSQGIHPLLVGLPLRLSIGIYICAGPKVTLEGVRGSTRTDPRPLLPGC